MKRMLALICAAVGVACITCACRESDDGSSYIKADAMSDPYGGVNDVALKNSGTVTLYWDTLEQSEKERDFADYFGKYYGGTVEYRFCPLEDKTATLLRDRATGDVADVIRLSSDGWPRAALRGLTYHSGQLKQLGVTCLDHPALKKYRDLTSSAFSYNGECYALSVCYASPTMVAVNTDLFASLSVKSPMTYAEENNWTLETMLRCCTELARTTKDGTPIQGVYVAQPLWLLQADDADPMVLNGTSLTSNLLSTNSLHALSLCRNLMDNSAYTDDAGAFVRGKVGMHCDTADRLATQLTSCPFSWDILPFPYGSENVSGAVPGTLMAWALPMGCQNAQGAVNFILARQLFADFFYGVDNGAFWDTSYARYSEKQQARIRAVVESIRPMCFPYMGNLAEQTDDFWQAVCGTEPIYDVASRFSQRITDEIADEMNEQALNETKPSRE